MKTIYPEVTHGIVNRAQNSVFSYQAWPSIARDENGTLYVVASGFRVSHICPFGKTVMYISKDGGKTWTPPIIINDTYMDDRDAGILYMGGGRLLVSWFTHSASAYTTNWKESIEKMTSPVSHDAVMGMLNGYRHLPEKEQLSGSYVRVSEDYGVTWGETTYIPVCAPHGPGLCKDGSLVYLGVQMYGEDRDQYFHAGEARCYRSEDGGHTWDLASRIEPPAWLKDGAWLDEPHVLELPDGRLIGAFRIEGPFTLAVAFSEDGGRTWSDVEDIGVCGSPPHLMLHSSGALICTYARRDSELCGECAIVSYDFGRTWESYCVLDDRASARGEDLGYSATVELDDGSLMTIYYQKYEDDLNCSILYTRWNLEQRDSGLQV